MNNLNTVLQVNCDDTGYMFRGDVQAVLIDLMSEMDIIKHDTLLDKEYRQELLNKYVILYNNVKRKLGVSNGKR